MAIKDFILNRSNRIMIGGASGVALIATATAAVFASFVRPAFLVENPEGERTFEVTTHGAILVGTGADAAGNLGECLTSGGGSGKMMDWKTCGGSGEGFNSGQVLTLGDDRYVRTSGDTMTGSLIIDLTSGSVGLEVIEIASGSTIFGNNSLRSSGALVWEGAGSGASLYVATSLNGAGLSDCDAATSTLQWNETTGRFSCDTTGGNTYTAGQGLTLTSTSFSVNSTLTGTMIRFLTISGATVYAKNSLNSSGTLTVRGMMIGSGGTLTLSRIGASTYSTVQDFMNFASSPGVTSGGIISVSGTTYTAGAGNGFIKASDSNIAELSFMKWSGSSAAIASNTTRYIGVDYNAGAPKIILKTTDTFDLDTQFPLGVVVNDAGTLYKMNNDWRVGDTVANIIERFDSDNLIERDEREGGLILGNTGTRNITVSAGALLARLSEFPISAIDTSASSTFDTYYRDGSGGWTKATGATQWDNTNYDDGDGGLGSVSALQYASKWFYLMSDGTLAMLYGRTVSTAIGTIIEDDTPPATVPDRIGKLGLLIGRIIFQGSNNTPIDVQSAFDTTFNPSLVSDHGELSGLTDDDHTQYLLANGTRALTGNWEAGNFRIDAATLSGGLTYGHTTVASSGTLVWETAASGATLVVSGQFSGVGLSDCDSTNSALKWDTTTKRFSCSISSSFSTGNVITIGDARYVNVAGDTMTGALAINVAGGTAGTLGLRIINMASGAYIHAEQALTSSGMIIVESIVTRGSGALVVNQKSKFGTGAYVTASGAPLLALDANGRAIGTTKHILFGYRGNFDTNLYRSTGTTLRTDTNLVWGLIGSGQSLWVSGTGSNPMIMTKITQNRIGMFQKNPSAFLHLTAPATVSGALRMVTMTAAVDDASDDGTGLEFRISGPSNNRANISATHRAGLIQLLNDTTTGSGRYIAWEADTDTRSTSTNFVGFQGNFGFAGGALGTTKGANAGAFANAENGGINVGFFGRTTLTKPGATNIGMIGLSRNVGTGAEIGGYFGLNTQVPTFVSGALVADNSTSTSPIILGRDNGSIVFSVLDGGDTGIGTSTPSMRLEVENNGIDGNILRLDDSDGQCDHDPESGSETVTCTSDARTKFNIKDMTGALAILSAMRIREYNTKYVDKGPLKLSGNTVYAGTGVLKNGTGKHIGVIAQEMLETLPGYVSKDDEGFYRVAQPNIWLLVEAIQELNAKIKELEKKIQLLESL